MRHWRVSYRLNHMCGCPFCNKQGTGPLLGGVYNGDNEGMVRANIEGQHKGYWLEDFSINELSEADYMQAKGYCGLPLESTQGDGL